MTFPGHASSTFNANHVSCVKMYSRSHNTYFLFCSGQDYGSLHYFAVRKKEVKKEGFDHQQKSSYAHRVDCITSHDV